jgi:hypothetical protein
LAEQQQLGRAPARELLAVGLSEFRRGALQLVVSVVVHPDGVREVFRGARCQPPGEELLAGVGGRANKPGENGAELEAIDVDRPLPPSAVE